MGDPAAACIVPAIPFIVWEGSFYVAIREFPQARADMGAWQFIIQSKDLTLYEVMPEDSAAVPGHIFVFFGVFSSSGFNLYTLCTSPFFFSPAIISGSHPGPEACSTVRMIF